MALVVFVVPLAASVLAAVLVSRQLPVARSWPQLALWWAVLGVIATAVLVVVDRLIVRLIPLTALHQLSALFPDRGVSRRKAQKLTDRALEDLPEPPPAGDGGDLSASFRAMLNRLQRHDPQMAGHATRVRRYADLIAEELEVAPDDRHKLEWAALVHDLGKLSVPERTLRRSGELAPDELAAIRAHPEQSRSLTSTLHPWLGEWALAIGQHHERFDGSGYPQGLEGETISLGARILAVADTFDALVGPRSYQPVVSPQAAREVVADGAGTLFDPVVVRAFLNVSIRRLRVVSGGLTWGLQSRATGLIDSAARLATTGTAIVAAGTALAIGGQLELPRLDLGTTETGVAAPEPVVPDEPTAGSQTEGVGDPTPGATVAPGGSTGPDGPGDGESGPPAVRPVGPVAPDGPPTTAPTTPPVAGPIATPTPAGSLTASWVSVPPFGSTLRPTEAVALTVTLTNVGPGDAIGTVATPAVPPGMRGVPGSVSIDGTAVAGSPFGGGIPLRDLRPGQVTTITYTLEAPRDAVSGPVDPPTVGVRSGTGSTTHASPGGYVIDADPDVTWTVAAAPSSGSTVIPGSRVTYRATVANDAEAGGSADGLTLAAALPAGLDLDPGSVRLDGASRSASGLAGGLPLPAIDPGSTAELVFDGLVRSPLADGSVLTTVVSLDGLPDGRRTEPLSHVVDATTAVTVTASAQPVSTVAPGSTITYTFDIANDAAATAPATGLVLTVPTPSRSSYVLGSTTLDGRAVPDASNPVAVGLPLPELAPGDASRVSFQVRVASPLENGIRVSAFATLTGAGAPFTTTVIHTVTSAPSLTLLLSPDRPTSTPVLPGDVIAYTLTLRNASTATAAATGVVMSLPTPANTTFLAGSAVDASGRSLPDATNPLSGSVPVPDLPPGSTASLRIEAEVVGPLAAGEIVTANGSGDALQVAPLSATISHTVAASTAMAATLAAAPPGGGTVTPGDTVAMTLTVTNGATATATATGLEATAVTTPGIGALPGTATLDGTPIAATPGTTPIALPDLAPGVSAVLRWQATVARPQPDGTVLASATTVDGGSLPAAIVTTIEHTVTSSTVLTLTTVADRPTSTPVVPGETLTYTVSLANAPTATETATGVTLRMATPLGTTFVPGSAVNPDGTASPSTTNPFSTGVAVAALAPGDAAAISISVTADSPRPNGSTIVASGTGDANELATPLTRTVTHTISSAPVITLTADSVPLPSSTVVAGSPITYRLVVANDATATEDAVGLDVRIPTPQDTTFASAVDETGATILGPTNPFETGHALPRLAPGETHTLDVTVTVDSPLPNGTPIQQVSSLTAPRLAAPLTATTDHIAESDLAVSVTVEATPDPSITVAPGTIVTYTVTAANASTATATATGVTVTAPDPADADYVGDSAVDETGAPMTGTTANPFAGGYALPDLAPGDVRSVSFQALLSSPLPDGTVVRQTSEVSATELVLPVRDFVEHTVSSAPDLSLSIRSLPGAGTPLTPGDTVRYLATVANSSAGTEVATGLTITLPTPGRTTYVAGSAVDETGSAVPGPVQPFASGYALPDLPPGSSVTVEFAVALDSPLVDGSTVAASGALDADQLGSSLTDAVTHPVSSSIALGIDLTAIPAEGSSVTPGDTVTYRMAVTNGASATDTATGATVAFPTPTSTTYVAGSARDENGDPVAGTTNPFASPWSLPDLAPGSTATLVLDVTVDSPLPDGTDIAALATADADQAPSPVTDPASHTVSSTVALALDVTATPPVSTTVTTGSTITYRLRATNAGSATASATGLVITGPTPGDTTHVADSALDETGATVAGPNPFAGGYGLPDLQPGEAWEVSFTVTVDTPLPDGTVITELAGLDADQLATPLSTSASHTVSSAVALSAQLTALPTEGGPVVPGSTVTYRLTIANDLTAGETATGLSATIPTPADTAYAPSSAVDESGATITGATNPFATAYVLPDLAPGVSWTLELDVVVDTPLRNGTSLTATASVDADQLAAALTDGAAHTVASAPALSAVVQSSPVEGGTVAPSDTVTYDLTVTNDGSATEVATGLVATLPVANDTTFVPGSAVDRGTPLPAVSNPFATGYALPDLAPGASWTISLQATVDTPLPNGTVVDTLGVVSADQLGAPLTDDAPLTVASATAPTVNLTATPPDGSTVRPTQTITYQLTVGNGVAADEVATGVSLTLPTPTGTSYVAGSARDEAGTPIGGATNPFASGYSLADLAPGQSATVSIAVTVDLGVAEASTIAQVGSLAFAETPTPTTAATGHVVEVYVASPFTDLVTVSEVFADELGATLLDNDEAVELRNLTSAPIDVSGWTVADVDVLGTQRDTTGTFTSVLPAGTVIPAYGHLVIWLGVDQSGSRPGFTDVTASSASQLWVGSTAALDANSGDDIWVYDDALEVVDRVAFGAGSELAPAPPTGIAAWDPTSQGSYAGAGSRTSMATTPSTLPSRSSSCWEPSASGSAVGDPALCPDPPVTLDTDPWPGRVTSLGDPNTSESPLRGQLVITEVLFRETGGLPLVGGNDEAIELTNISTVPLDLGGWTVADHDLGDGPDSASFSYTFAAGTVLPPGGIAVLWTGTNRLLSLPGFTNVGADVERYQGGSVALDDGGDDIWLYDPMTLLADYVGWGPPGSAERSPLPEAGFWDSSFDLSLGIVPTARTISSTPGATDVDTGACWEATTSDAAPGDATQCPATPVTVDTDPYGGRVTSLGDPNT